MLPNFLLSQLPSRLNLFQVVEGRNLVAMDSDGFSDPYVIVQVGSHKSVSSTFSFTTLNVSIFLCDSFFRFKTKTIIQTLNPVWDIGSTPEKFIFSAFAPIPRPRHFLTFSQKATCRSHRPADHLHGLGSILCGRSHGYDDLQIE